MAFAFSDQHIDEYRTQGYTVFRQLLPPSLVADLRRVCDEARDLARQQRGPQAQRLQPMADFPLDQQPFIDYVELPALNDALHRLLAPDFRVGGPQVMGVLFEPAESPWCTHWHRDWRDNMPGLELARWDEHFADDHYFNQVNCALYADSCTWVVPGSHLRRDLPCEVARFPSAPLPSPISKDNPLPSASGPASATHRVCPVPGSSSSTPATSACTATRYGTSATTCPTPKGRPCTTPSIPMSFQRGATRPCA